MFIIKYISDNQNFNARSAVIGAIFAASSSFVTAVPVWAECDFAKPIGACQARIIIDSTSGSKSSYSAEVTVRSSASSCSKVEYFLENTPHTTVIRRGNTEAESLFGTHAISKKSIKVQKCTAYASIGNNGKSEGSSSNSPEFFRGHWTGSAGILLFRGAVEVTIEHIDGDRATGFTFFPGDNSTEKIDGIIRGGTLSYSYTDLDHMNITLTKKGPNSIAYRGVGGGATITGTLTRR